jgi:hypothetical protein
MENHQGYRFTFGGLLPNISAGYNTPDWDSPASTPWVLLTGKVKETGEGFSLKKPLSAPTGATEVLFTFQRACDGKIDVVTSYQ